MKYYKNQDFIQKFGKRLKAEREAKNMSQEQLALLTEISQSQIARTELGNVNTSISHAALYANTLGIDVRVLFDFKLIS